MRKQILIFVLFVALLTACEARTTSQPSLQKTSQSSPPLVPTVANPTAHWITLVPLPTAATVQTLTPVRDPEHVAIDVQEQNEIKDIIETYFEIRYQSFSNLELEDFSSLVADTPAGAAFLQAEADKLSIELYYAEVYDLRYTQYEIFLDFKEIFLDQKTQEVVVFLTEGSDVAYPLTPSVVSSMRNQEHTITLTKIDGVWKLVNDEYYDMWWQILKDTDQSKEEILDSIEESQPYP